MYYCHFATLELSVHYMATRVLYFIILFILQRYADIGFQLQLTLIN